MNYTKKEIKKLLDYLEKESEDLANNGNISEVPYYRGNPELAAYQWLIIDVAGLGEVRLYYTSQSNLIKINNVRVDIELINPSRLSKVYSQLKNDVNKYKIKESKDWFKEK